MILISQYFCSPFIAQYLDMTYPPGNSPSKCHHLFSKKPSHKGNTKVLSYISSIWEDDSIEGLENKQWNYLWCNVIFQAINATKALYHVIRTKCMHIKRCRASIYQANLSRYEDLQCPLYGCSHCTQTYLLPGGIHCHYLSGAGCLLITYPYAMGYTWPPLSQSPLRHRWDLPGNYSDLIRVMVFYLSCQRSIRILFTAVFCHT